MVAINEGVPVIPVAMQGSDSWRLGNFHPVSLAWWSPLDFACRAVARATEKLRSRSSAKFGGSGEWLGGIHELGRLREATPPA